MTALVTGADGRLYQHRTAAREQVFIAEMPGHTSCAFATPHTGHALLVAWLDALGPGGDDCVMVRLPCGTLRQVRADAVRPAANVATRRLGPAAAARRTA